MKKIIKITLLLFIVAGFSSCLKDEAIIGPDAPGAIRNVVEFRNPARPTSGLANSQPYYVFSYDIQPSVKLAIPINFAGADAAPNDIKVTVALDQVALDSANRQQKQNLEMMPQSLFSVPSWEVTIPKGQRLADLVFDINTESPDFVKLSYGLGLKIVNVVGTKAPISGNYGSIVVSVSKKNKWDGIYTSVDGNMQRYSAPGVPTVNDALNGSLAGNPDLTLTTIDAFTVEISNLRWHGGSSGVAGIDNLRATVDPATNKVTMKSVGNATLANTTGLENSYNEATKTFTLNFRWNPAGATREITNLVLKFKKDR